jgi:hypothetical protein
MITTNEVLTLLITLFLGLAIILWVVLRFVSAIKTDKTAENSKIPTKDSSRITPKGQPSSDN